MWKTLFLNDVEDYHKMVFDDNQSQRGKTFQMGQIESDEKGRDDDDDIFTSLSKREKRPAWFDVFSLNECELLLVATAILI